MKALLLTAVVCLASTSFAEPVIINLLPGGNKPTGKEIKISLESAELSVTIKNMLNDLEVVTPEMKSDKQEHVIDLPLMKNTDERTLRAIANALDSLGALQKKGKNTFKTLKSVVLTFFTKPNSTDALNFLLAANFLDIAELMRPAAAVWIDLRRQEGWFTLKELPKNELKNVPAELLPLFEDYWDSLHNGMKRISRSSVLGHAPQIEDLVVDGDLLAVFQGGVCDVIDLKTNKIVENIGSPSDPREFMGKGKYNDLIVVANTLFLASRLGIKIVQVKEGRERELEVRGSPIRFAALGKNLYVLSSSVIDSGYISVIDSITHEIVKNATIKIEFGRKGNRIHLAATGDKLYVTNRDNALSVIDLATNSVHKDVIQVGKEPSRLAIHGEKLYVGSLDDKTISVIDVVTDKVVTTIKIDQTPMLLAMVGDKLFVGNSMDKKITAIDTTTDRVADSIAIPETLIALAGAGGKLYLGTKSGSVESLEPEKYFYYSK